jgi:two-component system chemotaxis response regulator CheB
MSNRDIVVIGASSGALPTLRFIADLPRAFPAEIFLVVHTAPDAPGLLPEILRNYSPLPVEHARDGEPVVPGRICVAPPDYHVGLKLGTVQVFRGPKENRHRPSIDVLFRSAAEAYGSRVIGVILTGLLDDGSSGLAAVRASGGLAIVQDPDDALYAEMPRNALAYAGADLVVQQAQLAAVLIQAAADPVQEHVSASVPQEGEDPVEQELSTDCDEEPSPPFAFSCPECGGVLREVDDRKTLRFRCRVGHALTGQVLLSAQSDKVEEALWTALRVIEEKAVLARKLRDGAAALNFTSAPKKFDDEAQRLDAHAQVIRQLLKKAEDSETS